MAIFCNEVKGQGGAGPVPRFEADLQIGFRDGDIPRSDGGGSEGAAHRRGREVAAIDGGYFGGMSNRPISAKTAATVAWHNQNGKRQCVVVLREHDGRTLPAAFPSEVVALPFIRSHVKKGTVINADEAGSWNVLHSRYDMRRINHEEAYSLDGACTNDAESFFSRMRRAEIGHHHHIAGVYLNRYAQESAWREDNRREANGEQVKAVAALALRRPPSVDFCGYWQRHIKRV